MNESKQAVNKPAANSDAPQWETSKENVAPMREGRDVKALNNALSGSAADIEQARQTHLSEIQATESGDDPLAAWVKYVKWAEQNYPSNSSKLLHAIETPCRKYGKTPKYKHDPRLTRLWVRYADMRVDKLDVYAYMKKHGIGEKCALFYEAWAATLELERKYDQAEEVYTVGTEKRAEPTERLATRMSEFHKRCVARAKRDQKKRQAKEVEDMKKELNAERDANNQKDRAGLLGGVLADGQADTAQGNDENQERGRSGSNGGASETVRPALGSISGREARTGLRPQIQKPKTKPKKKGLGGSMSSGSKSGKLSGSSSTMDNIQIEVYNEHLSSKDKKNSIFDDDADDEMPERMIPTIDAVKKENDGIPTQWAGETLKQNKGRAERRFAVNAGTVESFEVYEGGEDQDEDENLAAAFGDENAAVVLDEENQEAAKKSKGLKNKSKGLSARQPDDAENDENDVEKAVEAEANNPNMDVDMMWPPSPTINTRIANQVMDESLDRGHGPMGFLKQEKNAKRKATGAGSVSQSGMNESRELFKASGTDLGDKTAEMTINTKLAMEEVDQHFNAPPPSMHELHLSPGLSGNGDGPLGQQNGAQEPAIGIFQDDVDDSVARSNTNPLGHGNGGNGGGGFEIHEDADMSMVDDKPQGTPADDDKNKWFVDFFDEWVKGEPGFRFLGNDDPHDEQLLDMFDLMPEIYEGVPGPVVSLQPIALVRGAHNKSTVVIAEDQNNVFDLRKPSASAGPKSSASDSDDSDLDSEDGDGELAQIAVKVSDPHNIWEYYIYRLLESRRRGDGVDSSVMPPPSSIGCALAFYEGRNYSYLTLDRVTWASLRELSPPPAAAAATENASMLHETVVMLMMVDLLRAVEHVHACHVIHMDIATDNILFRYDGNSGGDSGWAARRYARDGSHGWDGQGVLLVDFNRAVDTRHASVGPNLVAHVSQCVTEMDNGYGKGGEWGFNYDCHSVANVILHLTRMKQHGSQQQDQTTGLNFEGVWMDAVDKLRSSQACDGPEVTVKCMRETRALLEDVLEQDGSVGRQLQLLGVKVNRMQTKHEEKKKRFK